MRERRTKPDASLPGSPERELFGNAWGVSQVPLPAAVSVHDEEVAFSEEEDPPPIRRPLGTDPRAGAVGELLGIARFKFHEGKVEEFKRLSGQAMDIVRAQDTGTLQYEIYFNEDQSECVVYERYQDSEAVIEHGAHVGDLNEAIFATGSVVSSELLGEPSAELTAMIAGSGVALFTPFLSM